MQPHERWSDGEAYERYVGRWSRLVAREFLDWLVAPPAREWLDAGCGTGALSALVLGGSEPRSVLGLDRSVRYAAEARRMIPDARARFGAADAQALPVRSDACDCAVSGLVVNFVPAPDRMVSEMARVVKPGGCVALYVWDYSGGMELIRHFWDAAVALDPGARPLDEGVRFPLCRPGPLGDLLRAAGLRAVEVRAIEVPTVFEDFDDYWSPFLSGQGPAPGYVASLDEARRVALREEIRKRLPSAPDGSLPLVARAWAARGAR